MKKLILLLFIGVSVACTAQQNITVNEIHVNSKDNATHTKPTAGLKVWEDVKNLYYKDSLGVIRRLLTDKDTVLLLATKNDLDTLTFIRVETDPIYAEDSATLLRFVDTLATLATKYDLDTLSRPTVTGTINRIPVFSGIHSIGNSPFYVSGTDTTLFSTHKPTGSFGKNLFLGGGGTLVSSPSDIYQGCQNTTLGIGAGAALTSGDINTFVGRLAGNKTNSGFWNVMIGGFAGENNTDGTSNIMIGNSAGKYYTGDVALTSPNGGIYIGGNSMSLDENQQNEIVFGNSAVGHGTNTATWGNSSITNHYFPGVINVTDSILVPLRAYNATTFNNSKRAVSEDTFRDKIESLSTGAPGGSDNQLQYKNGTAFAGATSFLYYNTGDSAALKTNMRIQRDKFLGFGNASTAKIGYQSSGTYATYLTIGNAANDKIGLLYSSVDHSIRLGYNGAIKLTTATQGVEITGRLSVDDDAYAASWNGNFDVPTKNAVYDKIQTLSAGAPTDATYITQTANATLTNEQALSALSTGIVKVTNGTGVLSTAVAGDFPTLNQNTTGSAASATLASNVTVQDEASDSQCFPTFVTASTGSLGIKTDGDAYQYDPTTGKLKATIVNAVTEFQVNGTAVSPDYTKKISISADSLKYASERPITLIAAPGAGKFIVIDCEASAVQLNYSTSTFTNTSIYIGTRGISWSSNDWLGIIYSSVVSSSTSGLSRIYPSDTSDDVKLIKTNEPIMLRPVSDITTGGGSIDIYITYKIITL